MLDQDPERRAAGDQLVEFAGRAVITTCRGGGRGSRAAEALRNAGVDAVSLHRGLRAWAEDGGAIVRADGSPGGLD